MTGCYYGPTARLLRENAYPDWTSVRTGLPRDAVIKRGTDLGVFDSHGLFVFALLFPGVTGIITGTNLSANLSSGLRDPHHSIPRGTLWAVFTSVVVHALIVLAFAASFSRSTLHTDTNLPVKDFAEQRFFQIERALHLRSYMVRPGSSFLRIECSCDSAAGSCCSRRGKARTRSAPGSCSAACASPPSAPRSAR